MTTGPSPLKARPRVLPGQTTRISTALGTAFFTLTRDLDGQPFEIFLNVGKAGSDTFASAEALGRLISLALRLNSPIPRSERVRDIANQLEHIGSTANGASLPSIPDALARVLRESLVEATRVKSFYQSSSEATSDKQVTSSSSETDLDKPFQPPIPGTDLPATKPRRNLLEMDLSLKGKKKKQPMDTPYSLPDEILAAAEQLADAILRAAPIAAYHKAKARLDGDHQARELLERFLKSQSDIRVRQSRNAVTQADVDQLRALQREVQANRIIIDYAETQQAAIAYLPDVNREINQLLGVDFASLAGPASC